MRLSARHLAPFIALSCASSLAAQSTALVSATGVGGPGNGRSWLSPTGSAVTPDGRWVVFHSDASNLTNTNSPGQTDVYIRDLTSGGTERISVGGAGGEPNGPSTNGSVSNDGRYVVFQSEAQNLAVGDTNLSSDIFLRDRQLGITTIISVSTGGSIGNAASFNPVISGDGLFIAYASAASNLILNDPNGKVDVFVRNLATGQTRMVTVLSGGADGDSDQPTISGDGRFIAFRSAATNLVAGDLGGFNDIFVRDMTGTSFELVSVSTLGAQADGPSDLPSISADGSRIVFTSTAANLAIPGAPTLNVHLRDRNAGSTTLLNVGPSGVSNLAATRPRISKNGEYVSFLSQSNNLTPGHSGAATDAFALQLSTGVIQRASPPITPEPSEPNSNILENGGISDDGRFIAFSTPASNLVAGDAGSLEDVFARDQLRDWFIDVDADQYGDVTTLLTASFRPSGYISVGGDCDDANPAVNPGATEVCNGIDDNCDGVIDEVAWQSYCGTATSQRGCRPSLSAVGFPSASAASGFTLRMSGVDGLRPCSMIHGFSSSAVAWALGSTSVRCVSFPWTRVNTSLSSGTPGQCDGEYSIDWLAFMAANPGAMGNPLTAGATFYVQGWFRDPGAPKNSNLANAVQFTLCP